MTNEEKLIVKIQADISDMKKGMDSVKKEMGAVEKEAGGLKKGFSKIGKVIAGAFAVKAIVDFGKKAVETAAMLQAMDAQFDQIFKGTEGEAAMKRINGQVETLGIHSDRLKKSWNQFGGQFKGAGMEGEQALSAVDKATRLAADSAAFYDKSLEDSSSSLASFLKGNFAAGDAIGVFTSAKQMDTRANETYGKSWKDLTEDERQWLLLDTVEKTYEMNGAMGQASREADAYENVMGNLKASWERFLEIVGSPILKIVLVVVQELTAGIQWLSEKIKAVDWSKFTEGNGIIATLKDTVGAVVQFFKDNWPAIQELFTAVWAQIQENWETIGKPVFDFIVQMVTDVFNEFKDKWPKIQELIKAVFEKAKEIWEGTLKPAFEAIMEVVKQIWEVFKASWPAIEKIVETAFKIMKDIWDNILKPVFDVIIELVKAVADKFKEHMPQIQAFFERMAEKIDFAYNNILKPVFEFIGAIVKWVAEKFKEYIGPIVGWIFEWFGSIYSSIEDKMNLALGVVSTVIDGIGGFFEGVKTMKDNVVTYFTDIYTGIKEKIEKARDAVKDAIEKIKGFFNFEFKWPKLKMPKFSIQGSMNPVKWLTEGVPKLSVNWNARGAIFKKPTILENGQGVGDASNGFGSSPEVVAPLSELKQMLGLDRKQKDSVVINLNGNYGFRDKDDMDYFMNQLALASRRT